MGGSFPEKGASQPQSRPLRLGAQQTALAGGGGFSVPVPVPAFSRGRSIWRRTRFGGLAEGRGIPASERGSGPPRARHATPAPSPAPRASATSGPLGRCAVPLPLGSARRSASLGPGPGPRAPHASPLAGAAPQMRLREEEPHGPAPREQRGGGGGDARGGGGRVAAPKTRRGFGHWLGAGMARGGGAVFSAHLHSCPATMGEGERVSVASEP